MLCGTPNTNATMVHKNIPLYGVCTATTNFYSSVFNVALGGVIGKRQGTNNRPRNKRYQDGERHADANILTHHPGGFSAAGGAGYTSCSVGYGGKNDAELEMVALPIVVE